MKNIIKTLFISVLSGTAICAGNDLWHDVLKDKVYHLARKFKKSEKN